tara:strand:- start:9406 stop:9570 length:165 start_codon:yes stop_codon:yes gene_type:complete
MNSISKITTLAIPAIMGISAAWLIRTIIKNEQKLAARELELEIQLGSKSLKPND